MNQSTAKTTRRQIRRALGPQGVEAVNHLTGVVNHVVLPQLEHLSDLAVSTDRGLDLCHDRVSGLAERLVQLERPWWIRLRVWAIRRWAGR